MVSSSTVLTLLGFCASVLFIVFVCSRLVCAIIRRVRRHRRRIPSPPLPRFVVTARYPSHLSVGLQGHVAGGGGLRPAAVAAFPTRVFSSAGSPLGEAADDSAMCVVCLAEYEDNEVLRVLPYCGHDFHVACIDIWLKQHSTCPVCRVSLRNNPGSKHAMAPRPIDVIVIPGCSPEVSGSNPCHYLFGARGHSPRTSPEVLTDEPAQANQIQVEVSGSNPCHYLFGARGHSPRASPEVLTDEPAQANQIQVVCHPSGDRGNNLTPSEASSPGENNNQTLKLNIETPCAVGSP